MKRLKKPTTAMLIAVMLISNSQSLVSYANEEIIESDLKVKEKFNKDTENLNKIYVIRDGIVNYADFLNGLTLAPLAAREDIPILYSSDSLGKKEIKFLEDNGINEITEVGFNIQGPRIISHKMIEFASSIAIILIWTLGLRRIMKKQVKGTF